MARRRLFIYLAAASGYTGLGMILGYVLSNQATNTPLWIGVVLAFLGSVLMGMFISARDEATTSTPTSTYDSENSAPSER